MQFQSETDWYEISNKATEAIHHAVVEHRILKEFED